MPEDDRKGAALLEKACHTPSSGHDTKLEHPMTDASQACLMLAGVYSSGKGEIAVDLAKARSALDTACHNHDNGGCELLFVCLVTGEQCEKDVKRALTMSDEICGRTPSDVGCLSLAGLYDRGDGVKKDPKRAREMVKRACKDEAPEMCAAYWHKAGMRPPAAEAKPAAATKARPKKKK